LIGEFKIRQQPISGRTGAPLVYSGKDFKLTVNATSSPQPGGGRYGEFRATAKKRVYGGELSCMLLR
jgi:hypothetical protein